MNYDIEGKVFSSISNTKNGEVGEDTLFYYHQKGNVVWAEYNGGAIVNGHLIAKIIDDGKLDMRYHHTNGELMVGTCISTPELLPDGKLKLKFKEKWQWLSNDQSTGYSEIIEVVVIPLS